MAKNIDPAFQAAPFLGESSHDPIEFTRRQKALKYRAAEERKDEMNKNIQQGLDKLMLDVKGWEDQEGFKEIMARQDKSLRLFTDLSKKGLNLTAPKTSQEIEAFRAINNYHAETKQLVDEWDRNKKSYDVVMEAIKQDSMKPESERKIDAQLTAENLRGAMGGKSIKDRQLSVDKILSFRPEIGDVHKYVADNLEFLPKPDVISEPIVDEAGNTVNRQREVETKDFVKRKEEALRKLFKTAKQPVVNAVREQKAKDKELDVMTDEDYFVSMYSPQFKQKFIDKKVGTGGGLSFSFLGSGTVKEPGKERKEPLAYGSKTFSSAYEFQTTKPMRIPLGANGSEIFMGREWQPLTGGGDVEGTLSFYDSNTDMFIFRTTQQGAAPFVMNNMTIAVPRSIIGAQADDLPIQVGGEVKKLKDIYGAMQKPSKSLGIAWSSKIYIPKKK